MNRLLSPDTGLLLAFLFVTLLAVWISMVRQPQWARLWMLVGLVLRVVGSIVFLYVGSLSGGGDYNLYFREGRAYADELMGGPSAQFITGQVWWGTTFMSRLAGVFFAFIGPTLQGASVLFSVIGFLGSVAFWVAGCRAFPALNARASLVWMMCFPSLWFWTSVLGKDAVVLFGLGLAVLGFVGHRGRTGWVSLVLGGLIVFVIRPQVVAVLALALVSGQLLGKSSQGSAVGLGRRIALIVAAGSTITLAGIALDVQLFSIDSTAQYIEERATGTAYGGSAIDANSPIWLAPITTLLRPFLWEANGPTALVASLEITLLWIVMWNRRHGVITFWLAYRRCPLMWAGIVFVSVYAVILGMSASNLGTMVRQRIHILPFLLLLLAGLRRPARATLQPARPPAALSPDVVA